MPIRGFPAQNVVACFFEAAGGGAIDDFNAPRNAPAKSPESYLDSVVFHSSFFQYEIAAGPVNVTINHTELPVLVTTIGVSGGGGGWPWPSPDVGVSIYSNARTTDILLFSHNLGYVPKFMVSHGARRLPDGFVVQSGANYRRRVSVWASSTGIYLRESAYSGDIALPAISLSYRVMVFRNSQATPGQPLFGGSPGQPTIIGRGVINSSKKYLRRTDTGDTPFAQNFGVTIDCQNGRLATATGGIVVMESEYTGSLVAPPFVSVGVD